MSSDPYAAPRTQESEARPRRRAYRRDASRWSRLVAALLDGVVLFAVYMALGAALALVDASGSTSFLDSALFSPDANPIVELVTGAVLYLAVNGYLLALRGQSVGKLICAIQIVDADTGEVPPPARTIGLRWFVFVLLTWIPGLVLLALIDPLFIFGRERRCLHDRLARTRVVNAERRA